MSKIRYSKSSVQKCEIIILDEATSALDEMTENKILNKIFKNKDLTVISISHRKNAIVNCNKIFEIKDKILEQK